MPNLPEHRVGSLATSEQSENELETLNYLAKRQGEIRQQAADLKAEEAEIRAKIKARLFSMAGQKVSLGAMASTWVDGKGEFHNFVDWEERYTRVAIPFGEYEILGGYQIREGLDHDIAIKVPQAGRRQIVLLEIDSVYFEPELPGAGDNQS